MSKTYEITLKLVGEVRLVDGGGVEDATVDVASLRKDFGKVAQAICDSTDLDAMKPCNTVVAASIDSAVRGLMIDMLHLARDMDKGKFRGRAFADAVKNGVLAGGSVRGDVASDVLRRLDGMGLTTFAPLIASSKAN